MKIRKDGFYMDENKELRDSCRKVSLMIALPIMIFPSLYYLFNSSNYTQFFWSSLPYFIVSCIIILFTPRWLFRLAKHSNNGDKKR